jgi:hypothetical protein
VEAEKNANVELTKAKADLAKPVEVKMQTPLGQK